MGKKMAQEDRRSLSENPGSGGCWKILRCKASEILRNEAYLSVRRSDEE
jgi:hypothetical protein